jgi:hypothetical protein
MAGGMIGSGRQMGSNALAGMQRYASETERQKAQIDMANKQIEQTEHAQNVQMGSSAGMAAGALAGGMATSWSGPGMIIGAAVGAIVGMVGGELFG